MRAWMLNYKKYVEENGDNQVAFDNGMMMFWADKGIVVTDKEFIHTKKDVITDSVRVYMNKKANDDDEMTMYIYPDSYAPVQLQELFDKCKELVDVSDYFRNPQYNSRLASNFSKLLESLTEIGYEHKDELIEALDNRNQG